MSGRVRSDRSARPPDSSLRAGHATDADESGTIGQFARGPVLAIAGAVVLVLSIASGFSGYFTDEMYFLIAGKEHLGWGYADQPPLVPLLARAMDAIFPGSVIALRLPATLATAAGVVVTALIARELGGRRRAQVLAAGAYAVSIQVGLHGLTLGTWTIDPVWWAVITWLLVRWARLRNEGHHDDRLLLWAGVVTAISLQTKFLIPSFWAVLALSVSVVGPRPLLRRPLLWVGGALAVLTTLPGLLWQAQNGWPQLGMIQTIAEGVESRWGRLGFVPLVVIHAGIPVGAVFWCLGLWRLLRSPELRPYRFLGWTTVGVLAIFLLAGGRLRYAAGLYSLLFATAAVEIQRRRPAAWWGWVPTWPVYTISALVTAAVLVLSVQSMIPRRDAWSQLAGEVAGAYHQLSPQEQRHTVVLAESCPVTAALDYYGPEHGLPRAYSAEGGCWYFGAPPVGVDSVIYVIWFGGDPDRLRQYFTDVRRVRTPNRSLSLYEGRLAPWSRIWPEIQEF